MEETATFTAFSRHRKIAAGPLETFIPVLKAWTDHASGEPPLIFDDQTGKQVDFDLRGTPQQAIDRAIPPRRPGRPKLGVIPREISLLPRHWEWLEQQPNGASAAIRRLVDDARKNAPDRQRARRAIDAAGRVLSALAGNLPAYEEASRALYAGDRALLNDLTAAWPSDIRA